MRKKDWRATATMFNWINVVTVEASLGKNEPEPPKT